MFNKNKTVKVIISWVIPNKCECINIKCLERATQDRSTPQNIFVAAIYNDNTSHYPSCTKRS